MTVDFGAVLKQAKESKFWGSIEVTFQDGKPTLLRKIETTKITEGNTHDRSNKF